MGSRASKYDKTLLPVGKEGFMTNFNASEDDYINAVEMFDTLRAGKPEITKSSWVKWWNHAEDVDDPKDPDYRRMGQDIWHVFDVDDNGTMSQEEYLLYRGVNDFGTVKQKLLSSYLVADRNGDGKLTRREIYRMFKRMLRMKKRAEVPGPHAKKMAMKLVPADKERIQEALENFLKLADKDNSGFVSLEEFMAAADKDEELFSLFTPVV